MNDNPPADNTQKFFSFLPECGIQEGQDIESGSPRVFVRSAYYLELRRNSVLQTIKSLEL